MNGYIGIDPGVSGGLSIYLKEDKRFFSSKMPGTERGLYELLKSWNDTYSVNFAIVEQVSGYIGKEQPGKHMFVFGQNYGSIRTVLSVLNIPYLCVVPKKWQRFLAISKFKGESKQDYKRRLKEKALTLVEHATLYTCDSILLAYYCFRTKS